MNISFHVALLTEWRRFLQQSGCVQPGQLCLWTLGSKGIPKHRRLIYLLAQTNEDTIKLTQIEKRQAEARIPVPPKGKRWVHLERQKVTHQ